MVGLDSPKQGPSRRQAGTLWLVPVTFVAGAAETPPVDLPDVQIHERSKKAVTQRVGYEHFANRRRSSIIYGCRLGEVQELATRMKVRSCMHGDTITKFRFKYRPIGAASFFPFELLLGSSSGLIWGTTPPWEMTTFPSSLFNLTKPMSHWPSYLICR